MAQNSLRSGLKKAKSGRFRVDFTVKNGEGHGGERGYAQIPHPIPHSSTQFHTVLHPATPLCSDLPCLNVNSKIPLCRPKMGDPYSGVLLYTVLYGKIPRLLQRGIWVDVGYTCYPLLIKFKCNLFNCGNFVSSCTTAILSNSHANGSVKYLWT